MMDVYFNGYGRWVNQIDDNDFEPIGDDYEVGGVFKLRDIDEKTYIHTGDFDHVRRLRPSIDHTDCAFNKIKGLYQCANPDNNPKFIFMDVQNRNPAFYCMDSYERINSVAINNAETPMFFININRNYKLTAINTDVIDSNEERESVTAQGEHKLPKDREITQWLRQTWIDEGMLGGVAFFLRLKKHINTKGSPILEHFTAGKDAGIRWRTSAGTTGETKKKTIQTKVSYFKKNLE